MWISRLFIKLPSCVFLNVREHQRTHPPPNLHIFAYSTYNETTHVYLSLPYTTLAHVRQQNYIQNIQNPIYSMSLRAPRTLKPHTQIAAIHSYLLFAQSAKSASSLKNYPIYCAYKYTHTHTHIVYEKLNVRYHYPRFPFSSMQENLMFTILCVYSKVMGNAILLYTCAMLRGVFVLNIVTMRRFFFFHPVFSLYSSSFWCHTSTIASGLFLGMASCCTHTQKKCVEIRSHFITHTPAMHTHKPCLIS